MCKPTFSIDVVVHNGKSYVAFVIHVDCQWIPIGNQNPLPDIKFLPMYDEWIFDVLLNNPISAFSLANVIEDFIVFAENGDASTSALVAWFNDP